MAASMYIVVEGDDPGFNTFVNGRLLARHEQTVEDLAKRLGVAPLIEFVSADEHLMAGLLDAGAGDEFLVGKLSAPQWFSGSDGLHTVRALVAALEEDHGLAPDGALVLAELREYEAVLEKAAQRGARWHLAVSWR